MTSDKAYTAQQRLDALLGAQTDWTAMGSFTNGWSKASGVAQYRMTIGGRVEVQMRNIIPGTTTNGTTIVSGANGLAAGSRPGMSLWMTARCDNPGAQTASFMFDTDGHIECWGIGSTATRVDCNVSFTAEN